MFRAATRSRLRLLHGGLGVDLLLGVHGDGLDHLLRDEDGDRLARERARVMRRRSVRMDTVIILYLGTSDMSLSYVDCSKRTWLFAFSLFFPFDHFFFLPLPPAMALAALAAFDSGALGGCWCAGEGEKER